MFEFITIRKRIAACLERFPGQSTRLLQQCPLAIMQRTLHWIMGCTFFYTQTQKHFYMHRLYLYLRWNSWVLWSCAHLNRPEWHAAVRWAAWAGHGSGYPGLADVVGVCDAAGADGKEATRLPRVCSLELLHTKNHNRNKNNVNLQCFLSCGEFQIYL